MALSRTNYALKENTCTAGYFRINVSVYHQYRLDLELCFYILSFESTIRIYSNTSLFVPREAPSEVSL